MLSHTGPHHSLTMGFMTFLGLTLEVVHTSLGTSTHFSCGTKLGTIWTSSVHDCCGTMLHSSLGMACTSCVDKGKYENQAKVYVFMLNMLVALHFPLTNNLRLTCFISSRHFLSPFSRGHVSGPQTFLGLVLQSVLGTT